jgi:hypothetical protein
LLKTSVSWIALFLALSALAFLAIYLPMDRRPFQDAFADFRMPLPTATALLLSIPDVVFPAVAGLLALVSVVVHWLVRDRGGAALFHMMIVVFCCVAFTLDREALFQPLIAVLHGLSR